MPFHIRSVFLYRNGSIYRGRAHLNPQQGASKAHIRTHPACEDDKVDIPSDAALAELGAKRRIRVFTRHYQAAMTLAEQNDLIVTLPTRATWLKRDNPRVVVNEPPFAIPPLELKMAWSPLLHNNAPHRWVRQFITGIARSLENEAPATS